MLETYFECEEGLEDQNLAPQLAGNQYAFGQAPAAQVGQQHACQKPMFASFLCRTCVSLSCCA